MFVKRMKGPEFPGNNHFEIDWQQIEAAIRAMNGRERNTLTLDTQSLSDRPLSKLARPKAPCMVIGGGAEGLFVLLLQYDNEFYDSWNPALPDDALEMMIGGQGTESSLRSYVSLDQTLSVAKRFAETGERDTSVMWRRTVVPS